MANCCACIMRVEEEVIFKQSIHRNKIGSFVTSSLVPPLGTIYSIPGNRNYQHKWFDFAKSRKTLKRSVGWISVVMMSADKRMSIKQA